MLAAVPASACQSGHGLWHSRATSHSGTWRSSAVDSGLQAPLIDPAASGSCGCRTCMPRSAGCPTLGMCAWDLQRTPARLSALQQAVLQAWHRCTTNASRWVSGLQANSCEPGQQCASPGLSARRSMSGAGCHPCLHSLRALCVCSGLLAAELTACCCTAAAPAHRALEKAGSACKLGIATDWTSLNTRTLQMCSAAMVDNDGAQPCVLRLCRVPLQSAPSFCRSQTAAWCRMARWRLEWS